MNQPSLVSKNKQGPHCEVLATIIRHKRAIINSTFAPPSSKAPNPTGNRFNPSALNDH